MGEAFQFDTLLAFGFMSIMLLVGVILRAKFRFIQRYLFPSCLVGGLIGMVLMNAGLVGFSFDRFEILAYHLFNISFISVGLTGSTKKEDEPVSSKKEIAKGASWMALVQGIVFPMQGIIGGLVVVIFAIVGIELFTTFGFLCPLGFNEGPGQALSFGKTWEEAGFKDGATIGVIFASVGFFFSFFVGVPLANWGLRKNLSAHGSAKLPEELIKGIMKREAKKESAGEITVHSGNIDNLAFQFAMVGLVYVLTYYLLVLLGKLIGPAVAKDIWGFFFFFGLFVAIILKWLMDRVGIGYLVEPGVQRRVTGWSVDFLIVATVTAIQFAVVWEYIVPISIIALTAGVLTTAVVIYLGRRVWDMGLERTLAIYGCVTGTVSSGLLLLRIVDPNFKTTTAMELGFMNIIVVPFILAGLILVNSPLWYGWSIFIPIGAFALMIIVSVTILRITGWWGERKF